MKPGLKFKLAGFITVLLLAVTALLSAFVLGGIRNYYKSENEEVLLKQKNMFEQYLQDKFSTYHTDVTGNDFQLISSEIFDKPWLRTIPASLFDLRGKLLSGISDGGMREPVEAEGEMLKYAMDGKIAYRESDSTIYYYSPLKYKNSAVAILRLEYPVGDKYEFYSEIKQLFITIGVITMLLGSALAIAYVVRFTRDIDKMKLSVENIQNGAFGDIVELHRSDELGDLSRGIGLMGATIRNSIADLEKERDSLGKAVEKLKAMDFQQREFINNVTHEFKTPLTSIKAYADILDMYGCDPELISEASANISNECGRLKNMIDRILNLSVLEKYDFEMKLRNLRLKPLIEDVCARMTGKFRRNNLELESDVEDVTVCADEESVRHILVNLLDNAIKYNREDGAVRIDVKAEGDSVCIGVADTGIGIPHRDLERIFDPFYRVKSDRSRLSGGAGLGLAFVKKLVDRQNGSITVESEEGRGSRFVIRIPSGK